MNRFVCGIFTWQELSSTNKNLMPRLREWSFMEEDHHELLEIYHKTRCADDLDFGLTLDLGNEDSPRVIHFYGHLPAVYCNDRYELSTQLDRAREKLLSAVIRRIITEAVTQESF